MNVYSFDVFDTVLTRKVLYPKDVFHLVQQIIPLRMSESQPQLRTSFHGYRVWSEFAARRKATSNDISLKDIYHELGQTLGLDEGQRSSLMELELEVESAVLIPVHGVVALMNSLRNEDSSMVFISDMYLPACYIRQVLDRFGLYQPGDRIYVSGEKGVTKGSGKLFKLALQEIGIKPDELVHYGDDFHSDYFMPKSMGIRVLHEAEYSLKKTFLYALRKKLVYLKELFDARIQISGIRYV